ncbi:hypothetical protein PAHAL_8G207800 [Panicum hallii]|uniref:Uncharacterized protein n=1 Tax=Panicum hallii TaxID=206008 RepID=A0A2T8I9M8_9POAL|nr:hypothetical protein PAHAL_8G207800 [Panicum hallii]
MAIAVDHFHDVDRPDVRGRHCRLHSVAQLDSPLLDRDHLEHTATPPPERDTPACPPRRQNKSSPCFRTVAPAGAEHADRSESKIVAGRHARGVRELIAEAAAAIAFGTRLVTAQSGLGGALLLTGSRGGEHVTVIK